MAINISVLYDDLLNASASLNESIDLDLDADELGGNTKLPFILLGIVGVCLCIIGIIGNIFSIIVLSRKSMKKLSTYSYLFGLAICDELSLSLTIMILIQYSVPPSVTISRSLLNVHKILSLYIIPIVNSTQALSVWITLAFTIDRYIFICHPYWSRNYCNRKRACIIIICLYATAVVYSIPQFFERTYDKFELLGQVKIFQTLTAFGRNKIFIYVYNLFIYSIFVCLVPFLIIFILNGFLIYDIIKSNNRHREMSLAYNPSNYVNASICTSNSLKQETMPAKTNEINEQQQQQQEPKPEEQNLLANGGACSTAHNDVINVQVSENNVSNRSSSHVFRSSRTFLRSLLKRSSNTSAQSRATNHDANTNGVVVGGGTHENKENEPCLGPKSSSLSMQATSVGSSSKRLKQSIKDVASSADKAFKNDVTIMLVGLIIVFLICQMPATIIRLITYNNLGIMFDPIYVSSVDISNFLIVANSTLNCILYIILGKKFRREFLITFMPKRLLKKANINIDNRHQSFR